MGKKTPGFLSKNFASKVDFLWKKRDTRIAPPPLKRPWMILEAIKIICNWSGKRILIFNACHGALILHIIADLLHIFS